MRDEKLRRLFKALADKTRFDIVQELGRTGESSVSDLCLTLGVTQPLMSWHVRMLRHAGVVATRRRGRQVFCSLDRQTLSSFHARFDALLNGETPVVETPSTLRAPIPG